VSKGRRKFSHPPKLLRSAGEMRRAIEHITKVPAKTGVEGGRTEKEEIPYQEREEKGAELTKGLAGTSSHCFL